MENNTNSNLKGFLHGTETDDRIENIRNAEKQSHTELYSSFSLYQSGSWLEKPVKTVTDLFEQFAKHTELRVLDLGSGVGRNSIAIAKAFTDIPCTVECVDILPLAIEKLHANAKMYGVQSNILGTVCAIENYSIQSKIYDLILSVSSLEHTDTRESFVDKLAEIRNGLRKHGIGCLIINSNINEINKLSGELLPIQFEVNLDTEELLDLLHKAFDGFAILKETSVKQQYDIPRENGMSLLTSTVVTYVAKKTTD